MKFTRLILLVFLLLNSLQSSATHVVGGELNYRWIGGNNYEIRLTVYRDCINGNPPFDNPASIGIFNSANNLVNVNYSYTGFYPDPFYTINPPYYNNATFNNQTYGFLIHPIDSATVPNSITSPCEIPPTNICYRVCHYIDTITLPPIPGGYHLVYQRCCRNFSIANIVNPLNTGSTYDAWIPASPNNLNSNPVFNYLPATYICVNNPFVFDHSATDYEGDSLVYQLCDPLQGATQANSMPQPPNNPPYATVTWQAPYSIANIFGGVPLTINPQTGLLTATPNAVGQYVYAVCVTEYRNGIPISVTRRDFQVNIIACVNITVASLLASTVPCGSHTATFTNNSTGASMYHWDFGDLSTNADTSNLFSPSYTYPDTGWYQVTLIAYSSVNPGCNDTSFASVHVRPLPVINVTPPPPICIGQTSATITATGTSTSYTWSPSTGLSNTTGSSVTANPTSTTTYTVTGTLNGCTASTQVTVTVNPLPVISVTPPPAICVGQQSATLTANGASTYAWTPSTALSATTGSTVTSNTASTTTYTVTGTDNNGCTASTQVTVNVNPLPVISVTPPPAICVGQQSATLTANGASTYVWTPSTALSATTGSTVTSSAASTTTYTVTGTDNNGCTASTQVTVTVNPLPVISVTPPPAICVGQQSATLTANGASTYSWTPSTALSATTGSTVTSNAASTTTYTVTGTDNNGCTASTQVTVTVNPLPVISVTPPPAICVGQQSATLTANGASTYSWTPSTALSATTGSTVTSSAASTTTYTVTGTDNNGCTASTQVTVTVNPLPVINVTPPPAICLGQQSATLVANGASTYAWTPSTALSATTGSTVTSNAASTTTYTVTGTDNNGCTASTQVTVNVNPLPVISVTPPPAICVGQQSATLTANGASTYSWTPSTALSATTGSSITANPTSTTTYTVTGTDNNGCTASTQVTVTVNPLPVISVTPPPAICVGQQSATLTANGASTYSWTPSTALSATTGSSVTANPTSTTSYTVTGTDNNGCTASTQVTVTVNPLPVISVTPPPAICVGQQSATLTANGASTYSWTPSTALSATTGSSVTATPASTTTYTVTGTDNNGCTASTQVTVNVNPLPVVSVTSPSICDGQSTTLSANGANTYLWSPATSLSATTGSSVTANPTSTITYTVTGTDNNGCTSTGQGTVSVTTVVVTVSPNTAICNGFPTTLSANGATTYTWSPSASLNSSTGSSVSANPSATTTYTVIGTTNGCTASAQVTVTVNGIVLSVSPATICQNQSTILTVTGATNYSWSPANTLSSSTGASVTANPSATTTYMVVGTSNGCSDTTQVTVTVNPLPLVAVTPPPAICVGQQNATLTANGASTYSWTPATALSATTGSNVTANPTSTTTYTVTGTDNNGCTSSTQVTVTVFPLPVIAVTPPPAICIGQQSATLTANGASTYSWTPSITLSATTGSSVIANPTTTTTYTVTGTDNNGCTASTQVTVTVNPLPQPAFTFQVDLCSRLVTFTNTSVNTVSSSWNFGDASTSALTNPTHTYAANGNYNVMLITTSVDGCIDTIVNPVVINYVPVVAAFNPVSTPCSYNFNFTNQSSGASIYNWNFGDASTSTQSNPSHTYSSSGNYTVTLIASDANGCSDTTSQPVSMAALPQANFVYQVDTCAFAVTFTNGSANANSYTWNFGDASTSAQTNPTHTYASTGNYNVTLVATSSAGCNDTATVPVPLSFVMPAAAFTINQTPCSFSISLNNQSIGANNCIWDFGDNTNSTLANPSHTYSSAGNYTITLIISGVASCTDTASQSIIINPLPSAAFNFVPDVCSLSAVFSDNSVNANSYSWNFGDATTSTQQNPSHTYSTAGTYTVTLTITDIYGCTSSTSQSVSFPALPVSAFTYQPDLCSRLITFTNTSANAVSYWWNFGDATTSSVQNPSHLYAVNGNYNVTLVSTSASGCVDTLVLPVNVNYVPITAAFNYVNPVCTYYVTFTNQTLGASSYYWDFGDSYFSSQFNPNHIYSASGNYTVTLIANDANGCSDTISQNITLPLPSQAAFSFTLDSCTRLVSFTDNSSNGSTYYWNFGDAGTSLQTNPSHIYSANGNYNVTLVATSAAGCADTMIITVPVNITLPVAAFTPNAPVCTYDVNLTNQSTNASTYDWNFGDNTFSNLANPTHVYQSPGNYIIRLVVTNSAGCIDSTANNIGISPMPQAVFTPQIDTCSLVAQFYNSSMYAISYYWNFGDSTTSVSPNPGAHTYPATGTYNVTLVVEDANGCRDTLTQTVNPYITSLADYTFSIDSCSQEVNFFNQSDFAFTYLWNFGDGQTSSSVSATHHYTSDGNYPVVLITNPGTMCADTAAYNVNLSLQGIGNIYVPNAFTPNSDGKNDIFEIVGYYPCEDLTLYIFNRWGELIYKKSGQHITWDGGYLDSSVKLEVYVYILQGTYFYQDGTITVIR